MSHPDPNKPYTFDPYLEWRKKVDFYADDPFIQKVVARYTGKMAKLVNAAAYAKRLSLRVGLKEAFGRVREEYLPRPIKTGGALE